MIFIKDRLSIPRHDIKQLTINDRKMCIHIKREEFGDGWTISSSRYFIEISKQDLKKADNIVVYEEKKVFRTGTEETIYCYEYLSRDNKTVIV